MNSVLIISPDSDRINQLTHMAHTLGKSAVSELSVSQAIVRINTSSPDIIVLDYAFGDTDLSEFAQHYQPRQQSESTALIMIVDAQSIGTFINNVALLALTDDWILAPFENQDLQLSMDLLAATLHEDAYLQRKHALMTRLSDDISAEESIILRQEKEELIRQIYLVLQQQIRHPMLSVLAASEVLKEQFSPDIPAHKIACQIEICAMRIRDILETLGNLKTVVLDDYLYGTTMVDFEKSAAQS